MQELKPADVWVYTPHQQQHWLQHGSWGTLAVPTQSWSTATATMQRIKDRQQAAGGNLL